MDGDELGPAFSKQEWDALGPKLQLMYPNRASRDVAAKDAPAVVAACALPTPSVPRDGAVLWLLLCAQTFRPVFLRRLKWD